jgi:hypothetical protein
MLTCGPHVSLISKIKKEGKIRSQDKDLGTHRGSEHAQRRYEDRTMVDDVSSDIALKASAR